MSCSLSIRPHVTLGQTEVGKKWGSKWDEPDGRESVESEWNDRLTPGAWVTLGPGKRHKTQSHNGGVGHEQLYSISRSGCSRRNHHRGHRRRVQADPQP